MSDFRQRWRTRMRAAMKDHVALGRHYSLGSLPWAAQQELHDCGVELVWDALARLGWVRISRGEDSDACEHDLLGDCYAPDCNPGVNPNVLAKQRKAAMQKMSEEGVWIYGAWVRIPDEPPTIVDSIGGFIGEEFWESGYAPGLMRSAIDEVAEHHAMPTWGECTPDLRHRPFTMLTCFLLAGIPIREEELNAAKWQ